MRFINAAVICALTSVLLICGAYLVVLKGSTTSGRLLHDPLVHGTVLNLARAVFTVLGLAYVCGLVGWLVLFLSRHAGVHKLADTDTVVKHPFST
jgi:hypothetical protein